MDIFFGDYASYIGDVLYGTSVVRKTSTPIVYASKDRLAKCKNIKRKNGFEIPIMGYREQDDKKNFLRHYKVSVKKHLTEAIKVNNPENLFGYCTADEFSSPIFPQIMAELKSGGHIKRAILHLILPDLNRNKASIITLDTLQEVEKLLNDKLLDSVIFLSKETYGKCDGNTEIVFPAPSVLEIIRKSFLMQQQDLDIFNLKNRIVTCGYAYKKLPKKLPDRDGLISEYVEGLTERAVAHDFISDINKACKKAYLILQVSPRYLDYGLTELMLETAKNLLPEETEIIPSCIPIKSEYIEIAGIFADINTNVISNITETINERREAETKVDTEGFEIAPSKPEMTETSPNTFIVIKSDLLDSMAIHAMSYLSPVIKECYGTIYADKDGRIVRYHPIDSEDFTIRSRSSVKFIAEFYDYVMSLSEIYEDMGLRLAGDNHSHPNSPPKQSRADIAFNEFFWKTDKNTCFVTSINHTKKGSKNWEIHKDGLEAKRILNSNLVEIRAYSGAGNESKKMIITDF